MKKTPDRERVLRRLRAHLEQRHYPRLAMGVILALASAAGFLASAGLLELGLRSMAWRYGLAALLGYAVFLVGLRLWLSLLRRRQPNADSGIDIPDPVPDSEPQFQFSGGGGFSGGGAGGPIDSTGLVEGAPAAEAASEATGAVDVLDAVGAADEGAALVVPVLVAGFIIAGLVGVVMVLGGAPALLAELLLDGVIAGAAYRRLRQVPTQHWLNGAVRRTWKPMLALTLSLVAAGFVAQSLVPTADSIGDFLRP